MNKLKIIFITILFAIFLPLSANALDNDNDGISNENDLCPDTYHLNVTKVNSNWCYNEDNEDWWEEIDTNKNPDTSDNVTWTTKKWTERNKTLDDFWEWTGDFVQVKKWWSLWIYNSTIRIAYYLKNLFIVIASIYFIILVLKIFFSNWTEEEVWKFKKWIVWTSVWIIIMQTSYSFITILFDRWVNQDIAFNFTKDIIYPFIDLLTLLVSFFFIAIAIFAFYRIITAWWDEEKAKKWKTSIFQAIIWFIVIKISSLIVDATYWKINCKWNWDIFSITWQNCIEAPKIEWNMGIVITLLNWFNNFIGITVILMIIYAWAMIMLSWWDEEKAKKWKSVILYVWIWLLLLASSYLILTFFILPESTI